MEKDKNYSFIAYIDESGDIGIREGKSEVANGLECLLL